MLVHSSAGDFNRFLWLCGDCCRGGLDHINLTRDSSTRPEADIRGSPVRCIDLNELGSTGCAGLDRHRCLSAPEPFRDEVHKLLICLAVDRRCLQFGEPRSVRCLRELRDACSGFHFDLESHDGHRLAPAIGRAPRAPILVLRLPAGVGANWADTIQRPSGTRGTGK